MSAEPTPAAPAKLLWTLSEFAHAYGLSERTARRMADAAELPHGAVIRLGRRRLFSVAILTAWAARGCPRQFGIRS